MFMAYLQTLDAVATAVGGDIAKDGAVCLGTTYGNGFTEWSGRFVRVRDGKSITVYAFATTTRGRIDVRYYVGNRSTSGRLSVPTYKPGPSRPFRY